MTIFDWLFVGLLSLAIVGGVLALWMIFLWVKDKQKYNRIFARRPRNKRKRKRWVRALKRTEYQKNRHGKLFVGLLVMTIVSSGVAVYGRYYQATNLGEADAANIANGYRLVYQVETQVTNEEAPQEEIQQEIYQLSKRLSSYGNRRASSALTQDGQLLLNRYYNQLSQLGTNLNRDLAQIGSDSGTKEMYLADIDKITTQQEQVFTLYSIDEVSLQEQIAQLETQNTTE